MTYLQDHAVTLAVLVFVATFVALLFAPLWMHMRWENRQRRRGGRFIR